MPGYLTQLSGENQPLSLLRGGYSGGRENHQNISLDIILQLTDAFDVFFGYFLELLL